MCEQGKIYSGGCLCGAVRYEIKGPLRPVVGCHCTQCQKTSGNFVAATRGRKEDLTLVRDEGLSWFQSSEVARRGFCGRCGGNLFYDRVDDEMVSIMAGSLDQPTGLKLAVHIRAEDKPDYYVITDGLPQIDQDELAEYDFGS